MNLQSIVQALVGRGLTQTEIASKCGCTQGRISEIANGKAGSVSFELGMALLDLHKRENRRRRSDAKTEQGA